MDQGDDIVKQTLKIIGERVREIRKAKYPNYESFANNHQFNKVSINRLERGFNSTTGQLIKVLQELDVSLEDFFKGL